MKAVRVTQVSKLVDNLRGFYRSSAQSLFSDTSSIRKDRPFSVTLMSTPAVDETNHFTYRSVQNQRTSSVALVHGPVGATIHRQIHLFV